MPIKTVRADSDAQISALFGAYDANIRIIEEVFSVTAVSRSGNDGPTIAIAGSSDSDVDGAVRALSVLKKMQSLQGDLTEQSVSYAAQMIRDGRESELAGLDDDCVCITERGKPIRAKTVGQRSYIEAIRNNTVVLGVGPAGTGKTFLAVAMAVTALRSKEVQRIILTRPAVEAGEKLGYLPCVIFRRQEAQKPEHLLVEKAFRASAQHSRVGESALGKEYRREDVAVELYLRPVALLEGGAFTQYFLLDNPAERGRGKVVEHDHVPGRESRTDRRREDGPSRDRAYFPLYRFQDDFS